jgi:protein disulfide-isomerase
MNRFVRIATLCALATALAACEPPPPYDESADAAREVDAALDEARTNGRLVMITFGANWCSDCSAFAAAVENPEVARRLDEHFVRVKVDVGNWDRNPDLVAAWGDPIAEGIPAVVIASPGRDILYATRRGEISNAAKMSAQALGAFLDELATRG